jgi:hypothetical protein
MKTSIIARMWPGSIEFRSITFLYGNPTACNDYPIIDVPVTAGVVVIFAVAEPVSI